MATLQPTTKRWSREQYHRMEETGVLRDERTELIDGEVLVMSPQGSQHYLTLDAAAELLRALFATGFWVRIQGPLALSQASEPEPDISVVRGSRSDFRHAHPTTAALVVEVSLATLDYDRTRKASLYASAGIGDYWILNLRDGVVEIHRDPTPDSAQPFGYRYNRVDVLQSDESIAPLAAPQLTIAVADLLP